MYIRLYSRAGPSKQLIGQRVRDRVRVGLGPGNGLFFFHSLFFLSFSCLRCMVLNN